MTGRLLSAPPEPVTPEALRLYVAEATRPHGPGNPAADPLAFAPVGDTIHAAGSGQVCQPAEPGGAAGQSPPLRRDNGPGTTPLGAAGLQMPGQGPRQPVAECNGSAQHGRGR